MKDLVSIIIPVYNSADVLKRCINSALSQCYPSLEIIFIDDGSTDHSGEILDDISQKNSNVIVLHADNHGVSHARNLGLDKAHGKWIMFLDADDTLCDNAVQKAVDYAEKFQCDTVCFNAYRITTTKTSEMKDIYPDGYIVDSPKKNELLNALYDYPSENYFGEYFRACWGKLLSSEIIQKNGIRFPEDLKIGEDAVFLSDYFFYSRKVLFCNYFIYNYYLTLSSATGCYKNNLISMQKTEFSYLYKTLAKYGIKSDDLKILFWVKSKNDFIHNEFKNSKNINKIIASTADYLKDPDVSRYLSFHNNSGIKSFLRALLIKLHLYKLVSFIDVYNFYRHL